MIPCSIANKQNFYDMVQLTLKIHVSEKIYEREYDYLFGDKSESPVVFSFYNIPKDTETRRVMTYRSALDLAYRRSRDERYRNYNYFITD